MTSLSVNPPKRMACGVDNPLRSPELADCAMLGCGFLGPVHRKHDDIIICQSAEAMACGVDNPLRSSELADCVMLGCGFQGQFTGSMMTSLSVNPPKRWHVELIIL